MGGPGSAGSGKWRALGLLSHPEALEGPPGGPAWRRPLLTLIIGLGVVAATGVIAPNDHETRTIGVPTSAGEPEVVCT